MTYARKHWLVFAILALVLINLLVWAAVLDRTPKNFVEVSFLDVGQGDAILIEGRTGNQLLIDGGSGKVVLRRLSKELPLFDRSIDFLLETHPDRDHIGGFPYVLDRFKVESFIEPGVESENAYDDEIRRLRKNKNIPTNIARRGMVLDFKDGSYLEIIFPDRDVFSSDTNEASVIARYIYKNSCFLLTGDSTKKIEGELVSIFGENLNCQVLKVGHHGSRTSTGESFLDAVSPEYAIISAGKDNSYGHPHEEVMDLLKSKNIKILETSIEGTIVFRSDGEKIFFK